MPLDKDNRGSAGRQGRMIALVIAGTAVLYVIAQVLGAKLGLEQRTLALFDLIALGGFLWCLILTWQLWRKQRDE